MSVSDQSGEDERAIAASRIPVISAVSAEITARLEPFDGDMRRAFARIDELVEDIAENTAFSNRPSRTSPVSIEVAASGDSCSLPALVTRHSDRT